MVRMLSMAFLATTFALATACGGADPAPPKKAAPPAAKPAPAKKAAPKVDPAVEFAALDEAGKVAKLMELGKSVYETGGSGGVACVTCHQATGAGLPPSFPPLVGQKDHMGDCANHAGQVINGQSGEIVVDGITYNGVMPAQGNLSDLEIAAVITYERSSWGNDYGHCMPEQVAAAR